MKVLLVALAFFSSAAAASEVKTYLLDGNYGPVSYEGTVTRVEQGDNYLYQVELLHLTFDPAYKPNLTDKITSPSIRFSTAQFAGVDKPYRVTFEAEFQTDVRLDANHLTAEMGSISFSVPKAKVAGADDAGLSLVEGRWMWPLGEDMRH